MRIRVTLHRKNKVKITIGENRFMILTESEANELCNELQVTLQDLNNQYCSECKSDAHIVNEHSGDEIHHFKLCKNDSCRFREEI